MIIISLLLEMAANCKKRLNGIQQIAKKGLRVMIKVAPNLYSRVLGQINTRHEPTCSTNLQTSK